jgi:hydroxypyruvate reductase/glycerate 2-kinase
VTRFVNEGLLTGHGRTQLRSDALAIADAAIAAVDPERALRALLRREGDTLHAGEQAFELAGRGVFVIGAGKATIGMAGVLDELLGERLSDGAVVVKHGQGRPLRRIEVIEAAHPVPDIDSLRGGLRLLEIARRAQPGDLVFAVVTGGSSALAIAPAPGISFDDKVTTNRLLLACGADIVSINNVRKHLSQIKGGFLAAACGCRLVNFSVSDVVGDPPDYFTDLTVPDRSTFAMAQEVCDRFALWDELPRSVVERLRTADPAQETPKAIAGITTVVVANSAKMCAAAAGEAGRRGYSPTVLTLELEGAAREAGAWLAERLAAAGAGGALIAGGENTVTLAAASAAAAAGGPNQEAALAAAAALPAIGPSCVLCLDSDGTDGPTDAAGGLVDDLTPGHARELGVDVHRALADHASHDCLRAVGDLVVSGPTGTNVNDLKIALTPPA